MAARAKNECQLSGILQAEGCLMRVDLQITRRLFSWLLFALNTFKNLSH
jgi:hypothetical protein